MSWLLRSWHAAEAVWEHIATVIGGAIVSLILPVREFMYAIAVIVAFDLYMGWRVLRRNNVKNSGLEAMKSAVATTADYFGVMIVTNAFQVRFMPTVPLIYLMAMAISVIELKKVNEKMIALHGVGLFSTIFDRLRNRGEGPNR